VTEALADPQHSLRVAVADLCLDLLWQSERFEQAELRDLLANGQVVGSEQESIRAAEDELACRFGVALDGVGSAARGELAVEVGYCPIRRSMAPPRVIGRRG